MKILLVGDYPPPYGGVSVQVAVLHRRLSALPGVTCRALDIGKSRSHERRECLPARNPLDLGAKLMRHAANGYTIHLHTNGHNRKSWLMSLACAAAGCLNRRRTVLTFGSGLAPDFMARADAATRLVIRGALRLGGAIVCRNERTRDAMLRLGASAEKIAILSGFYGVDLAAAAPVAPEVERFIGQHSPVVGAIASPGDEYGIALFVKAAARLRPRYPGLGVLLIGAYGVDAHGLDGGLLLTGELPHGVVLSVLRGLDLFARPTYFDGDASSVREALALGVPVVASDTDFRPEGVVRFHRGDVDDLTDKMARTLLARAAVPPHVVEPESLPKLLAIYDGLQSSAPLKGSMTSPLVGVNGTVRASNRGTWLWWAGQAVLRELLNFRFEYPIETCPDAGRRGELRFWVYSDCLFLENQELDARGVPMKQYRVQGSQYNPLFVAWWGLMNLQWHLRGDARGSLDRFFVQVEWLKSAAIERADGAVVWPVPFDWQEGFCALKAPWISAMYQAVAVSTLVRAYRLTGEDHLLSLSRRAVEVFRMGIEAGGVRTREGDGALYEEYPGYPLPRVLDGFLFSLLGLYDLYAETGDPEVHRLFTDGVEGLRRTIRFWDYRGKWSWYGSHGYLCPPHYHALNQALLAIVSRLCSDRALAEQAERWNVANLTWPDRVEVYALFAWTKNLARLRLPKQRGAYTACAESAAS